MLPWERIPPVPALAVPMHLSSLISIELCSMEVDTCKMDGYTTVVTCLCWTWMKGWGFCTQTTYITFTSHRLVNQCWNFIGSSGQLFQFLSNYWWGFCENIHMTTILTSSVVECGAHAIIRSDEYWLQVRDNLYKITNAELCGVSRATFKGDIIKINANYAVICCPFLRSLSCSYLSSLYRHIKGLGLAVLRVLPKLTLGCYCSTNRKPDVILLQDLGMQLRTFAIPVPIVRFRLVTGFKNQHLNSLVWDSLRLIPNQISQYAIYARGEL